MSKSIRNFLFTIAPLALLSLGGQVHAQATDVDCIRCVNTGDIATDAVTTFKIRTGAVRNSDIAKDAVTSIKIKNGEVRSSDIANGAVTSSKIRDSAVKTSDIANRAVTADKLADSVADQLGEVTSGIEFGAVSGSISGTVSTIASVTVTAPGPGYVRVSVNSYTYLNFTTGTSRGVDCTINTAETAVNSADALPESRDFEWIHSGMPSGFYYKSLGSAGVHTIGSAGTYTYYMRCRTSGGAATWSIDNGDGSMQAMYFAERL